MVGKGTAVALAIVFALSQTAFAQQNEQKDSLIRLVSASSVSVITLDNEESFRKAIDAVFLHNGTNMLCDTAFWKVDDNIVNAIGHVVLEQDSTMLTAEKMDYFVDENLAKFRGDVVELSDTAGNILRTRCLDYNTADSTAVFFDGAALKDKDGQVIESLDGSYDSKTKVFTFRNKVNMYTDTVFLKTSSLEYHSNLNQVLFTSYVDFWRGGNMLSAAGGWYDHGDETFFFTGSVHAMSDKQEAWSDTLYFYRATNNIEMMGDAQLQDTSRRVAAFADYIFYEDTLSKVTMCSQAAVSIETDEGGRTQTVWLGADSLEYYTVKMCDIGESEKEAASTRVADFSIDPVGQYRAKAAAEAKEAADKAAEQDPQARARKQAESIRAEGKASGVVAPGSLQADNPQTPDAPEAPAAPEDTTSAPTDSVAVAPDTTKVGFANGFGNVRVFRSDIQVRSDEMHYTDLDSVARFYQTPIVWNEGNRQYTSDSLFCLVKDGRVTQASLMSNAFITTEEAEGLYDQIKGAEVMAYFDSTTVLERFDALGGAMAIFYLMENDVYSTVNKVESKMISATFEEGQIDKVYYFDAPKNDAYPVVQFPKSDRFMKGFDWRPELRPSGKESITSLEPKPTERMEYAKHPRASFPQTDIYFPGYMAQVRYDLNHPKPKPSAPVQEDTTVLRRHMLEAGLDSLTAQAADSLVAVSDTLAAGLDSLAAAGDTLAVGLDSLTVGLDSLASYAAADSLAVVSDSAAVKKGPSVWEKWREKSMKRRSAADARAKARQEAREARWKALDERDAEREAVRQAKALEKKRAKTRKDLIAQQKQDLKDKARLQKYIDYYQKQKAKKWNRSKTNSFDTSQSTPSPAKSLTPSLALPSRSTSSDSLKTNFHRLESKPSLTPTDM